MVDGQVRQAFGAILAFLTVTAKYLSLIQFHLWTRALDHLVKPNNGGAGIGGVGRVNCSAPIRNQLRSLGNNQTQGTS